MQNIKHLVETVDQLVQVQQTSQKGDGLVAGEVSNNSSSISDR